MRIFLTGGTGLVGTRLSERLFARGDQVSLLTRRPDAAKAAWGDRCTIVAGDPTEEGPWMEAVRDCDGVVHLAGEGIINRRWRPAFKDLIRSSRVKGTTNVARAVCLRPTRADGQPKVLVSASAVGYYGPRGDEEIDEDAPPGDDFLAGVCQDWEASTRPAEECGARVVRLRIGVVLDNRGGPLSKMLPPVKMFVGGTIASGRQVLSWVHHEDLVGLILLALDNAQVRGPMNAAAPGALTNKEFMRTLGHVLHRPAFMPMPGFALRLLLGGSAHIIITGQRVVPRKATELGYEFKFPEAEAALRDLLGR